MWQPLLIVSVTVMVWVPSSPDLPALAVTLTSVSDFLPAAVPLPVLHANPRATRTSQRSGKRVCRATAVLLRLGEKAFSLGAARFPILRAPRSCYYRRLQSFRKR